MKWNGKSAVTFEEADEACFIWYYARYLPEGSEIRENSRVLDRTHQVQYGRVAGHCQYGSQYYFDIMTVALDTELTTHYTGTKSMGDRSSVRCYISFTVLLGIILVNNQLHAIFQCIYYYLFHVSTCFEQPSAQHQENRNVSIHHLVYITLV